MQKLSRFNPTLNFTVLISWLLILQLSLLLDPKIFLWLNGSFSIDWLNPFWIKLFGLLNHRLETKLNLLLAAVLNFVGLFQYRKNPTVFRKISWQLLFFWIGFQLFFTLQDWFFNSYLRLVHLSPSLVIQPAIKLSIVLQNTQIKDASYHSFPSGHAFSMLYWGLFSAYLMRPTLAKISLFLAFFFSLPRIFSGAHWVSDVVFSMFLAFLCFLISRYAIEKYLGRIRRSQ
ncbi:MAG: phosphatase PAP2 family protein [Gammaproteobacteria bacterium]